MENVGLGLIVTDLNTYSPGKKTYKPAYSTLTEFVLTPSGLNLSRKREIVRLNRTQVYARALEVSAGFIGCWLSMTLFYLIVTVLLGG